MIELNLKAKPFNIIESVLGTELYFLCAKSTLFGYSYLFPEDPEKEIAITLPSLSKWTVMETQLQKDGWKDIFIEQFSMFSLFQKDGHLLIIANDKTYPKLVAVNEAAAYLKKCGGMPNDPGAVQVILDDLTNIIVNGWTAKQVETGLPFPEEEPVPAPTPTTTWHPAGTYGGWGVGTTAAQVTQAAAELLNEAPIGAHNDEPQW